MSLKWGGAIPTNSGYSEGDMSSLGKMGGLLGKLGQGNTPSWMTDDKGLFQGGREGRAFGRIRDWFGDTFGSKNGISEEDYLMEASNIIDRPTVELDNDEELDIDEFDDNFDDIETNLFKYNEPEYNFGKNSIPIINPDDTEYNFGANSIPNIKASTNNSIPTINPDDIEYNFGGNSIPNIYSNSGNNFDSSNIPENVQSGVYNFLDNSLLGDFLNINPSKVDNDLIENQTYDQWLGSGNNNIGGGQGWNQSNRGSNWKGTY